MQFKEELSKIFRKETGKMTEIKRLGLGTMGMNLSNAKRSIETIHYAFAQM